MCKIHIENTKCEFRYIILGFTTACYMILY